ncbi:MAG: response regulator transcription factor [Bacteroidetes bacterium]|nr:response regulator transcription factor [Bacteroidota bacterium]
MKVLIIEDERKAAAELRSMILALRPNWIIADILPSAADAIEWLTENRCPDLIFSDIQLADAVSFRIFETVRTDCPIIFCTAYDEYAIQAFETNGIDYLLKPVDMNRLERSLSKLELLQRNKTAAASDITRLIGQLSAPFKKTVLVHLKDRIVPVAYSDIAFFYYAKGIVTIRLISGSAYHIPQGMDELETAADPHIFYRANRQFLINRDAVRTIEKFFARKLVVRLTVETPEALVVSKAKASDFLNWLEKGL